VQPCALRVLVAESPHRVTCVAPFVLLANISDQHVRALYLHFESGDQRIFCVNNNVFRFPPNSEANSKLHVILSTSQYLKASIMPIAARSSDVLTGYAPASPLRRDIAEALAEKYNRGHTENMREAFIKIQDAIEAIERAVWHERYIAGQKSEPFSPFGFGS